MIALTVIAYWAAPDPASPIHPGPWYSVLPPLLAVTLAIVTGRILSSLLLAIIIGGLLVAVPEAPLSVTAWASGIYEGGHFVFISATSWGNIKLLVFVTLVLAMIATVIVAGGLHGIVEWLSRFAKGPRSVQFVTLLMGITIFIDDYANTMIVGASMRPVTDTYKVSREKLAFLVDSTSAPVAGLAVVSTWVGYEVGLFADQAQALGIHRTGYAMLFDALQFRFYCIMMLFFVFISIVSGKDYGSMATAERRSRTTGALAHEDAVPMTSKAFSAAKPHVDASIRAMTGVIPIVALFIFLLGGIWVDGGGGAILMQNPSLLFSPHTWRNVISDSEHSVDILAYAATFGLVLAAICARLLGKIDWTHIGKAVLSGARSSLLPILILVLAWSLKEACDALRTGPFLVAAVGDVLSPAWFPAITFSIAALTSFSTGTSYGTMAILMPTAVPIAYHIEGSHYDLITMITLAAILDGSIVGDHCSPISDTTIMSSISSSCDHLHHVRTQLPYSLTCAFLALSCGYIPAGLGVPSWVSLVMAVSFMAILFWLLPQPAYRSEGVIAQPETE